MISSTCAPSSTLYENTAETSQAMAPASTRRKMPTDMLSLSGKPANRPESQLPGILQPSTAHVFTAPTLARLDTNRVRCSETSTSGFSRYGSVNNSRMNISRISLGNEMSMQPYSIHDSEESFGKLKGLREALHQQLLARKRKELQGVFCPRCKVATYCNYNCQGQHWTLGHSNFCRCSSHVLELIGLGINKIDLSQSWSARVEFPSSIMKKYV